MQVRLTLVHETAEDCDAAFTGPLLCDLTPIVRAYRASYGEGGEILLHLQDTGGEAISLLLPVPPPVTDP